MRDCCVTHHDAFLQRHWPAVRVDFAGAALRDERFPVNNRDVVRVCALAEERLPHAPAALVFAARLRAFLLRRAVLKVKIDQRSEAERTRE